MTKKEFFGLLERYEKGLATEEEIELFESFFQSFQKHDKKWKEWDLTSKERIKVEIYQGIKRRIYKESPSFSVKISKYWKTVASVAAVMLFLFAVYFNIQKPEEVKYITKTTLAGQ